MINNQNEFNAQILTINPKAQKEEKKKKKIKKNNKK